jgi:hypothetical protein
MEVAAHSVPEAGHGSDLRQHDSEGGAGIGLHAHDLDALVLQGVRLVLVRPDRKPAAEGMEDEQPRIARGVRATVLVFRVGCPDQLCDSVVDGAADASVGRRGQTAGAAA